MTKTEFVIKYVLNRASIHPGGLYGDRVVSEALKAWKFIIENKRAYGEEEV